MLVVEGGCGFVCVGVAKAVVAAMRGVVCGCGGGCAGRRRRELRGAVSASAWSGGGDFSCVWLRGAAVASSVAGGSSQAGNRHVSVVPGAPAKPPRLYAVAPLRWPSHMYKRRRIE
jgi:hypothetical protein